ncbi:MAG: hypothetical protein MI757_01275, partial [Pirellulales bacterium]|nr:hypothetical protein [Pirellulales bacterium]
KNLDEHTSQEVLRYAEDVRLIGMGRFNLDLLLYQAVGINLRSMSNATLDTLGLPPKIIAPFLVMILFSLITRRNSTEALDRYYTKMKTPVDPDHEADVKLLEAAYESPESLESKKLFPGTQLEFQRPSVTDVAGFVISCLVCFGIIGVVALVTMIGS